MFPELVVKDKTEGKGIQHCVSDKARSITCIQGRHRNRGRRDSHINTPSHNDDEVQVREISSRPGQSGVRSGDGTVMCPGACDLQ